MKAAADTLAYYATGIMPGSVQCMMLKILQGMADYLIDTA
jgi:hypothetical protein